MSEENKKRKERDEDSKEETDLFSNSSTKTEPKKLKTEKENVDDDDDFFASVSKVSTTKTTKTTTSVKPSSKPKEKIVKEKTIKQKNTAKTSSTTTEKKKNEKEDQETKTTTKPVKLPKDYNPRAGKMAVMVYIIDPLHLTSGTYCEWFPTDSTIGNVKETMKKRGYVLKNRELCSLSKSKLENISNNSSNHIVFDPRVCDFKNDKLFKSLEDDVKIDSLKEKLILLTVKRHNLCKENKDTEKTICVSLQILRGDESATLNTMQPIVIKFNGKCLVKELHPYIEYSRISCPKYEIYYKEKLLDEETTFESLISSDVEKGEKKEEEHDETNPLVFQVRMRIK